MATSSSDIEWHNLVLGVLGIGMLSVIVFFAAEVYLEFFYSPDSGEKNMLYSITSKIAWDEIRRDIRPYVFNIMKWELVIFILLSTGLPTPFYYANGSISNRLFTVLFKFFMPLLIILYVILTIPLLAIAIFMGYQYFYGTDKDKTFVVIAGVVFGVLALTYGSLVPKSVSAWKEIN